MNLSGPVQLTKRKCKEDSNRYLRVYLKLVLFMWNGNVTQPPYSDPLDLVFFGADITICIISCVGFKMCNVYTGEIVYSVFTMHCTVPM